MSIIGKLLKTWTIQKISRLLFLVIFYLTGLKLGDSHLVILPICSLVLSSFFIFILKKKINFLICSLFLFHLLLDCFVLLLHKVVFFFKIYIYIYIFLSYKKKGVFFILFYIIVVLIHFC